MNLFVAHIVSGHSFFSGVTALILATVLYSLKRAIWKRLSILLLVLGLIAITVSATPLPFWLYGIGAAATCFWLIVVIRTKKTGRIAMAHIIIWMLISAWEIPAHLPPKLESVAARRIAIIGDSITAGASDRDTTTRWPEIMRQSHDLQVDDVSHFGATAKSALSRLRKNPVDVPLWIVEIGGNDVLGLTSVVEFEGALESLLQEITRDDSQVLMFELPLPPFYNRFGMVQRKLARRYGVKLIPKSVFLKVIGNKQATTDSIHLTQAGHDLMASEVWALIEPAFE